VIQSAAFAWKYVAEAASLLAEDAKAVRYMYGLLTRLFIALIFARFDPLSLTFLAALSLKAGRILLIETAVWQWALKSIITCGPTSSPLRLRTAWGTRRVRHQVNMAGLQENIAAAILVVVLAGEELAV